MALSCEDWDALVPVAVLDGVAEAGVKPVGAASEGVDSVVGSWGWLGRCVVAYAGDEGCVASGGSGSCDSESE